MPNNEREIYIKRRQSALPRIRRHTQKRNEILTIFNEKLLDSLLPIDFLFFLNWIKRRSIMENGKLILMILHQTSRRSHDAQSIILIS